MDHCPPFHRAAIAPTATQAVFDVHDTAPSPPPLGEGSNCTAPQLEAVAGLELAIDTRATVQTQRITHNHTSRTTQLPPGHAIPSLTQIRIDFSPYATVNKTPPRRETTITTARCEIKRSEPALPSQTRRRNASKRPRTGRSEDQSLFTEASVSHCRFHVRNGDTR